MVVALPCSLTRFWGNFAVPKRESYTNVMIRSYQGHTPTIPATCYVDLSAQVIGDVVLGEHASVWMNAVVRGDVHAIRIGANPSIRVCSVLHAIKIPYGVR